MKYIFKITFLIVALMVGLQSSAQSKKLKLAVLDPVVAGEKLSDGIGISVREIVSSCFVNNADNYSIVERSLLDKVMQEAKFSNSDAVDESQATRLGKLAGADKVIVTVLSRFDNRCMISIKMINVETATIDQQISKMVDYNSLLDVAEPLTLAVLGKGDGTINVKPGQKTGASGKSSSTVVTPSGSGGDGITGVTLSPTGIDIPVQSEEFVIRDFNKLQQSNNFNVVIDFSDATVVGMPFSEFIESKKMSDPAYYGDAFLPELRAETSRILTKLNKSKDYNFGFNPKARATLYIKVRIIDENGKTNTSDYVFVTNTGEIIGGMSIRSKGGRFGGFANLLGDALEEDAAGKLMKGMKKAIKTIGVMLLFQK